MKNKNGIKTKHLRRNEGNKILLSFLFERYLQSTRR